MTCYNSELPIGPAGPTGPQGPQGPAATPAYKVYTALLTQSEENAPTAIELENTIGDIEWSYAGIGSYKGTLASAFTTNKTFVFINTLLSYDVNTTGVTTFNVNEVNVTTGIPNGGEPTNGQLINTPIEIRVYP
jgi:hypothetical protein